MNCQSCGTFNDFGRKFCVQCGARLAIVCASCGTSNPSTARFCGECGSQLGVGHEGGPAVAGAASITSSPVSPAIPGPMAERRLVSILFADLVGFTGLSEGRDPEVVREFLSGYFELAREIVERYGGTIEKFIGDAVMAAWGTPVTHEDDAERAVRAALELVEAVAGLRIDDATRLQARAAVMTGETAVTIGAVGQGMVAGDLVNTASRLQSVAQPGMVLVGEATYRAASGAVAFDAVGDQQLRGKALPVPAFRALRVVAKVGGVGRAEGLEPPFVGRHEHLRLLKELVHATARDRRLRFVSVVGHAGTGKSRLVWELNKYIDGLVEPINWHQGRSPAYGEGVTFWALGEMVRKRAGLAEGDDGATTRAKIADALATYVPDAEERRWIEPTLLQLLGLDVGRTPEREELFAAWRTFFERVSEDATTVLVFEDVHWADEGLLDFIEHLADWATNHPILLITLARPDFLERRPMWGAGRRDFAALALDPLSDDAMTELLSGLVPGLPGPALLAVLDRAEGIPLYAVETVRKLLLDGRIEPVEGGYRPVGDLSRLDVPESLHALISARLDALASEDRLILQAASVLGQTFQREAVAAICGMDAEGVEPRLRELTRREVLFQNRDPRSPERGQYGFVQALIREVAYATLARRDRRARHLAAARYFESLGDDELAGALATHYVAAFRASDTGPEADAVGSQARIALRAAAERAFSLRSLDQALDYLREALTVSPDAADRAPLLELMGSAASRASAGADAERAYREAIEAYRSLGDRPSVARVTAALGLMFVFGGDIDGALRILSSAADEFGDLAADPNVVVVTANLARAYVFHNEIDRAIQLADRALVQAEALDATTIIADAVMTKGVALAYAGRRREAIILMTGVLDLAREQDLVEQEIRAHLNISQFQLPHDPRAAGTVAREGMELARRRGYIAWWQLCWCNATVAALATGDWDWIGSSRPDEPLRSEEASANLIEGDASVMLVRAFRGAPVTAEFVARAERWAATSTDPQNVAQLQVFRAWRALADGPLLPPVEPEGELVAEPYYGTFHAIASAFLALWARDESAARQSAEALTAFGLRGNYINAYARTISAGRSALEGSSEDGAAAFAAAVDEWRRLDLPLGLALTEMTYASLLHGRDNGAAAAEEDARSILRRLGAGALEARLDELLLRSEAKTTFAESAVKV